MKNINLSYSSIETLYSCERKFFLRYVKCIPEPSDAPYFQWGSFLHYILQHLQTASSYEIKCIAKKVQTDPELREKYWNKIKGYYSEDDFRVAFYNIQRIARYFLTQYNIQREQTKEIKHFVKTKYISFSLKGIIDLMYITPSSEFVIADFKSSKSKSNHSKQLGFYYFLLTQLSDIPKHLKPVGKIYYICFKQDNIQEHYELNEQTLQHTQQYIHKSINYITSKEQCIDNEQQWKQVSCPSKCLFCGYYKKLCHPNF